MDKKPENLAIGEIELNDGEFAKDELDKGLEAAAKETEKELEKSEKIVIDINDAEADEVVFKDLNGKKLKLSEDIDEDIRDAKGLGKAYKNARWSASHRNIDFHNADYKELTPEEAYKLIKQGKARDLRLLVDNKLITLKDTGYGSTDYRTKWVPDSKAYYKKSGEMVTDTAHMPVMHLLDKVADKIYLTNEMDVNKDPNLLAARKENPESPNYEGPSLNSFNRASGWGYSDIRGTGSRFYNAMTQGKKVDRDDYYYKKSQNILIHLKELKDEYKAGKITKEKYDETRKNYLDDLSYYTREANERKDDFARARYANSELALQKNLNRFTELKNEIKNQYRAVSDAQKKYDTAKEQGAVSTRDNRNKLADYKERLKSLAKEVAYLEFKLEDTSEEDEAAAKQYKDALDEVEKRYNNLTSEMDTLLRRK